MSKCTHGRYGCETCALNKLRDERDELLGKLRESERIANLRLEAVKEERCDETEGPVCAACVSNHDECRRVVAEIVAWLRDNDPESLWIGVYISVADAIERKWAGK